MSDPVEKTLLQPGQSIKPFITLEHVPELIANNYNLLTEGGNDKRIEWSSELNGYDDKNFLVEIADAEGNKDKYILKVLNSLDSESSRHVEAEITTMLHLSSKGIMCPVPVRTKSGAFFELLIGEERPNQQKRPKHIVRMLRFVEGTMMHTIPPSEKLLFHAGKYIAEVDKLLKEISLPTLEGYVSMWSLLSVPDLRKFLYVIEKEGAKLQVVTSVLDAFDREVVPLYSKLERGIIHGDFNEQNVLIGRSTESKGTKVTPGQDEWEVTGVIDFGDMQIAYYVFELAISMTYMMLECVKSTGNEEHNAGRDKIDPFVGAGFTLKGYETVRPVPPEEIGILRTLIAGRLCQSLVLGAYSYSLDVGNEYLLTTAKTGWNLLFRLWNEVSEQELLTIWNKL